ncbi:GD17494 [Drosophila simulans]|uniref:GD17494 n=1 Tax=Drosophila simulans TaxID=7240 RepID=B4R399_DROSI|nr:GD17494 [Drosophila simulans]
MSENSSAEARPFGNDELTEDPELPSEPKSNGTPQSSETSFSITEASSSITVDPENIDANTYMGFVLAYFQIINALW